MKDKLVKRLTISMVTLIFVLTTVFTNLAFAATPNINSNIKDKHVDATTENRVVYTYLTKAYFEKQFRSVGGIKAIVKNDNVAINNSVVASISKSINNTSPQGITSGIIRDNVASNYENLRNQLIQASNYDDWCIIIKTNYGSSKSGTSINNPQTYNKLVSIKTFYEVGE